MECFIIPGILFAIAAILFLIVLKCNVDGVGVIAFCIGAVAFFTLLTIPLDYHIDGRNAAMRAEIYYQEVIEPNIVQEYSDYVIVSNVNSALWQMGDYNLTEYNNYLKVKRYWDAIPIIGSVVFPPPEHLKYARPME